MSGKCMKIPFLSLKNTNSPYEKELKNGFNQFLEKGQYILGQAVEDFEKSFAHYTETPFCVGVANGLDALSLILEAFDFEKNSEILVPANTYFATILAIVKAGHKPVLIEPDDRDFLLDGTRLEEALTKKTVAVLAVNLYGRRGNEELLSSFAKKHRLKLFVDAAQSHGATLKGQKKTIGIDATAYSFYPSKNLGAFADAGAIVTSHEAIYRRLLALRNYGSTKKYIFDYQGYNSRLSELQAILLTIKLKYLDIEILKRRQIAERYLSEISNPKISLPPRDQIFEDVWHLFVIRVKNRTHFTAYLTSMGIGYDIHYPIPPHKQKALDFLNNLQLPITEKMHTEVLSLPLNPSLKEPEIEYIISKINNY
jgi:dTDP-4-amino-4,6-dideoxygalactose transaminase